VFAVVDHDEGALVTQLGDDAGDRIPGSRGHAEGGGGREQGFGGIVDRAEVDEPCARKLGVQRIGQREGERGLADAPRSGQRHAARGANHRGQHADLLGAADQPRRSPALARRRLDRLGGGPRRLAHGQHVAPAGRAQYPHLIAAGGQQPAQRQDLEAQRAFVDGDVRPARREQLALRDDLVPTLGEHPQQVAGPVPQPRRPSPARQLARRGGEAERSDRYQE
jgi:hypothetical protein